MHAVELVFAIGWAAFWIYWLVAAFSMKRGRLAWSRELRIRAVIVVLAILLVRLGAFRGHGLNSDPVARWPRARPLRGRTGVRHLGPRTHRAQLGHPDVAKGRPGAGDQRSLPPRSATPSTLASWSLVSARRWR